MKTIDRTRWGWDTLFSSPPSASSAVNHLTLTCAAFTSVDMPKAFDPTDRLSAMLRAIADPTRRKILRILRNPSRSRDRQQGLCATDIEQQLNIAQPTVSHHLRVLKSAGLIVSRKEAQWVWFHRKESGIRALAKGLRDQLS